ncbi:LysR family transcriptional regulator [Roseovarius sp. A21]|uniref:LysR family transcriptional regulator n=1 Tax=Roseovarius bejariae TaxID=2576383 RepID=A0A844CUZ8_9RHOB|nr:LysR substrate-binding domain-containing protein [Roseovarius bejariae]MRU14510.1 LysR family transcriptional regulator [Roseovarius bejariae]
MNLSFRQLQCFREVILAGSISQAARSLGRTQPAVSAMIAGLEEELGFALFLREQGKLMPTPEARYFFEECEEILARLEQTKRTLSGMAKLERGRLRIACHPAASGFFLPRVLTSFLKGRERVEVSLMMRSSAVIEDLVASQQFDLGFAETPKPRESIRQEDFGLECVCALPPGDPLAARDIVTPADLEGRGLAMLFDEHVVTRQTREVFAQAGCGFERVFELQTFLPGIRFVEAGLCTMICDLITAHTYVHNTGAQTGGVVFRPFRPTVTSGVSVLTPAHATASRMSEAFCAHLVEHVGRLRDEVLKWKPE